MPTDSHLRRAAGGLGLVVSAFGVVVLGAALAGSTLTRSPLLGAHAAAAFALLGFGLWSETRGWSRIAAVIIGLTLALALAAVGLQLAGASELLGPSRLSWPAAACVGASALGVLGLRQVTGRKRWPFSAWLANLMIAVGAAVLLAQAFPVPALHVTLGFPIVLILLGTATLLARPDDIHVSLLFQKTSAGLLARRLFFGVALLPLALGTAVTWLFGRNLLTGHEALLVFVGGSVLCGFAIALFSIHAAENLREQREDAERARLLLTARVQQQAEELRETVDQRTRELSTTNASLRAAAESNALLAAAAENSTNGVVITDPAGLVQWVNRAFTRLTGFELEEIRGRKPGHLLQGHDTDPAAVARLREAQRRGEPVRVELLNYTKYGRPFFQVVDLQPVRDSNGRLVNFVANHTDITAEHEAGLRTRALNERLGLALRSSNFGVWEYDIVNDRRIYDDRMLEIYGLAPEQFNPTAPQWESFLHPDDRVNAIGKVGRLISGQADDFSNRFRVILADGRTRHIESHGYLQRDPNGRPIRVVGLTRDITKETELQQALALAEQRWQLAIEGTDDSVWDWDVTTGLVYHDDRWARMLGYEPTEMPNTNEGWKTFVHPDDLPANEAAVREHFEQRTAFYRHEVRMRARDGTWHWILDRGRVVRWSADGRPLRMAGTHTDITPRKQLEERLRKSEQLANEVSRLAMIGGWEIDLQSSRVTWTEGTRRIHEVDDNFQPTIESVWQFFPPDSLARLQASLRDATASAPSFDIEVQLLTARGRRVWVRMLGHGEFSQGKAVSVHGAIQDITARHESEEARRSLETQLFQAQKMETLGTLAGGIAHDFNNLLTGIIGYHELAADSLPEDHPSRMCLNEARNASLRARELVEQILTFGRQTGGGEHGPIDLSLVVEEARRFLRATLPANITIETHIAPHCGSVNADATQIHQVILNLGSNAAHAMRHNGGLLRITLEPAEVSPDLALTIGGPAANSYVRLSVSDTGHGMDESTRRRIFDPFFTTKKTREGTGLGLAVVHGIVRSHRGAIDVESTPGRGSTFHIYLPTTDEDNPTAGAETNAGPRGAGEFICVVDDEEVVASCTRLVLENKGYRTVTYGSAEQCLAELEADPSSCSLLLTDQTMPGMQGTELAAAMRKRNPKLPVVIMSGYFSKISPQALDELGQVELLAKPFTTDELALAVHRALHGPSDGGN